MYFKQKLAYMALGCLFTIIGYILASLSGNPVDAQPQADKSEPTVIDEVVCRKLRVVNDDGETVVLIMGIDGGSIAVTRPNSKVAVSIGTGSNGGHMGISHASGEMAIAMGIADEDKEGFIAVKRKDQKGSIQLSASEYGGSMAIFNKGEQNVLQAGVGDTGSGIITTRDKHGYRTGRLP